ncbi:glutamine synthetase, partial [Pseudomonadales bacterium]|nr:glutamine synthetase [Pseudomonadales bacterium]
NAEGENLFALVDEKAPAALRHFIGGLQTYLPEAFLLLAPNINSYKRFAGDRSMPINLEWGYDNRTTGLRVPYGPPEEGRVETRVIGADANPYLMIAAILSAGLLGLEEAIEPTAASEEDCWELTTNLPDNLDQALVNLDESTKMADLMTRDFLDVFASARSMYPYPVSGAAASMPKVTRCPPVANSVAARIPECKAANFVIT